MRIRLLGDPVLRMKAKDVEVFDDGLKKLASDLAETMYMNDGVGLAAPQVGLSIKLVVVDLNDGSGWRAFVNPKVVDRSKENYVDVEGCLSIPGIFEEVPRPIWIVVEYLDLEGGLHTEKFEYQNARVLSHEIDHLHGKLFIDYLGLAKRRLILHRFMKMRRRGGSENANRISGNA